MSEAAILIPTRALAGFSEATRKELLVFAGIDSEASEQAAVKTHLEPETEESDEGPADFTVAMARKLIAEPISAKSTAILRMIAESATPEFHLKDAIAAAPGCETYRDLSGAWSGITRRARKILNDSGADFIWWRGQAIRDEDNNYVDQVGCVSPLTHQSLRAAFGVRNGR